MLEQVRSRFDAGSGAFIAAPLAGVVAYVLWDMSTALVAFNVALYGWFVTHFAIRFLWGLTLEDAREFEDLLLNGDDPAMPLAGFSVAFVSGYFVWESGLIPWIPKPSSGWSIVEGGVGILTLIVWVVVVLLVFTFTVLLVGDGIRRVLGKEPMQW